MPEEKLEEAKAAFASVTASHLYSLSQPGGASNAAMWSVSQQQDEQLFNQVRAAGVQGQLRVGAPAAWPTGRAAQPVAVVRVARASCRS